MNRIDSLRTSQLVKSLSKVGTKSRSLPNDIVDLSRPAVSLSFAHRVFTPEHYESRYEYPLVIWLHSDRSSEYEIDQVMSKLSLRNYVAIGLRGTQISKPRKRFFDWSFSQHSIALTEECLFESIDRLSESMSIHPGRIFLAGMGRGGTLAQYIGLRHPDRFAGVASVNGPFPTMPRSLVRWKEAKQLPILWMHGNSSGHCGLDAMTEMLEMVFPTALKVFPVQFASGDELDSQMLVKMNRFMMQIVNGEPVCLHEAIHAE